MHPNNDFVLFCPKHDDPVINKLNPIKIRLDDENILDPETKITPDELENTCCLFDDTEAIPDKKIREGVEDLRDQLLTVGRSKKITVICISHLILDWKRTKIPVLESNYITLFPRAGQMYQMNRFLKQYCGLDKKQCDKIKNLKTRWICLHKNFPMYLISKDYGYLL
jgi:hypothetical protein